MDGKKSRWTEKMDEKKSRWTEKKWMKRSQDGQTSVVCVSIIIFISTSFRKIFFFFFHLDTSYILSKMSPYYFEITHFKTYL
jgi:hypothetical protein